MNADLLMPRDLTEEERAEWQYRYDERLGILCQLSMAPTVVEIQLAMDDANDWVRRNRAAQDF